MADPGFTLSSDICSQITQGIVDGVEIPLHGHVRSIVGPRKARSKLRGQRNERIKPQGASVAIAVQTVVT